MTQTNDTQKQTAAQAVPVDDGGQAFPRAGYDGPDSGGESVPGMTLRDYFAAKAMQGFMSDTDNTEVCKPGETHWTQAVSRIAYQMADSMIAARKGGAK